MDRSLLPTLVDALLKFCLSAQVSITPRSSFPFFLSYLSQVIAQRNAQGCVISLLKSHNNSEFQNLNEAWENQLSLIAQWMNLQKSASCYFLLQARKKEMLVPEGRERVKAINTFLYVCFCINYSFSSNLKYYRL